MYKEVLRSIEGVEIYPIVALLIFLPFFLAVVVRTSRVDKEKLRQMAMLPLDASVEADSSIPSAEGNCHE